MSKHLIPMFSMTGKPTGEEIDRLFSEYESVGIDTLLLYPRTGLEYPYLSDEYFRMLRLYLDAGRRRGFRFWLYDEYNWPSGQCGGLITQTEEYCLKALRRAGEGGTARIEICRTDGNGTTYPDVLSPAAVRAFIRNTHERYKHEIGSLFGNSVIGFFSDEPSYVYIANRNAADWLQWRYRDATPYYSGMEEDYRRLTGRDLREDFLCDGESPAYCTAVGRLLNDRFLHTYMDAVRTWCEENGLLFTGHLYSEHDIAASVKDNYDLLRLLRGFSRPGIDNIFSDYSLCGCEWDALSAVEYTLREKEQTGVAELFALGPVDLEFTAMKRMIWLCAAFGISDYVSAVAPFDARGNFAKPDYYTDFTPTDPRFPMLGLLSAEADRAAAFAVKKPVADVAVVYPVRAGGTLAGGQSVYKLSEDYLSLLRGLVAGGFLWRVTGDGSSSEECAFLFEYTQKGLVEKRRGITFAGAEQALAWLAAHYSAAVSLQDADTGAAEKEVFIKKYEDGSLLLLNLTDEPKRVAVSEGGVRRVCELYGVRTLCRDEVCEEEGYRLCGSCGEFGGTYLAPSFFRPVLSGGSCTFSVGGEMPVTVYLRTYPQKDELLLDGIPVVGKGAAKELPRGFAGLYASETRLIARGEHILSSPAAEKKFLPICILGGDFDASASVLTARSCQVCIRAGQALSFFGTFELRAEMDLSSAEALGFSAGCPAALSVGGVSLGMCAEPPFIWKLPEHLRCENMQVRVCLYSSLAPLFGNTAGIGGNGGITCSTKELKIPPLEVYGK